MKAECRKKNLIKIKTTAALLFVLFVAAAVLFGKAYTANGENAAAPDMGIVGVSVKYDVSGENVAGLRFSGRINKALVDGKSGVEYGILFLPRQLYVSDSEMTYDNVGYGRVAKADCTGRTESDGDYYNIAAFLRGINTRNYNCDYYALVYLKDGESIKYSPSKHSSIAETAKYLIDNGQDSEHTNLFDDFILKYPVTFYGYNGAVSETQYVRYGESADIPQGINAIDGYYGYVFDKWVKEDGGNEEFGVTESIKGTTDVYAKYDEYAGVAFKDVNMGEGDCGTVDVAYEDGELITVGSSSQQWYGLWSFSDTVWNGYLSAQSLGNKVMTMDVKFGSTVSLSGYVKPTNDSMNINHLRTDTEYFRFYDGEKPVEYGNLTPEKWYKMEIDVNGIKNIVGEQSWNGERSGIVLSRQTEGTISVKNVAFSDKYDLSAYKYSSVTDFDGGEYNASEWFWNTSRNVDGTGLYADVDNGGNGFLNFDGAAQNSVFGTEQTHKNFELSFDIYDAKTSESVAPNGEKSDATSDLRITFGQNSAAVSDLIDTDSAYLCAVTIRIAHNSARTSTDIAVYEKGVYIASASMPAGYGFFSEGYAGKKCRLSVKVNGGAIEVSVKHTDERTYIPVITCSLSDKTLEGYVCFRGYGNRYTIDRTINRSSYFKIDNIVLGNLSETKSVSYSSNIVSPPSETVYVPKDNGYLSYPKSTAQAG